MEDEDFLLALQLQEQLDNEGSAQIWGEDNRDIFPVSKKRKVESSDRSLVQYSQPVQPERPLSIVDESWEMLDPNPDIRGLFLQYNSMFFWGKLSGIEVKWSPRMTLCAGVCSYEGRGGLCSIRLSEPLLKLRPRKDLVETLLHEMIHALLFVTQNNRDRDGHGPEFCKHMNRINQASGTKISIYHSFHDEVDVYRQHWWRCNGPCQHRKPFFGYVKRAMNRAPSARDPWWADHQQTCGGTYTKIKEPENYGKNGKNTEKKDKNAIKKSANKISPSTSTAGSGSQDIRNIIPFTGRGFVLGGSTQPSSTIQKPPNPSPRPVQETAKTSPPVLKSSPSVLVLPKRSVSNTKAFININGSPVRITKNINNIFRPKQRTVQDLFQAKRQNSPEKCNTSSSASKPESALSATNRPSNRPPLASASNQKSSSGTNSSSNSVAPRTGSAGSPFSKYFRSPKNSGNESPGSSSTSFGIQTKPESSIPRSSSKQSGFPKSIGTAIPSSSSTTHEAWKKLENTLPRLPVSSSTNFGRSNPAANSDQFRSPEKRWSQVPPSTVRPVGSPNKLGTSSGGRKRQMTDRNSEHIFDFFQRISHSPTSTSSRERQDGERDAHMPTAGASGVSSVPLSSSTVTVHCPVCQSKVFESQINEHLDSCLK